LNEAASPAAQGSPFDTRIRGWHISPVRTRAVAKLATMASCVFGAALLSQCELLIPRDQYASDTPPARLNGINPAEDGGATEEDRVEMPPGTEPASEGGASGSGGGHGAGGAEAESGIPDSGGIALGDGGSPRDASSDATRSEDDARIESQPPPHPVPDGATEQCYLACDDTFCCLGQVCCPSVCGTNRCVLGSACPRLPVVCN
jgi:hypothetical protein